MCLSFGILGFVAVAEVLLPGLVLEIFERESIPIVKAGLRLEATIDGAKENQATILVESATDMDAQGEAERSGDIECGCCSSDYHFQEMVQVTFFGESAVAPCCQVVLLNWFDRILSCVPCLLCSVRYRNSVHST
jgi:hypothetical protein